jgi:hypothetical protein
MKQKFIQLFIGLVLTTEGRYVGGERVPRQNLSQCFTVFVYKISKDSSELSSSTYFGFALVSMGVQIRMRIQVRSQIQDWITKIGKNY